MRHIVVSCVRDELDIIEPFVRHCAAFAERLIVMDNGSTDGTLEILQGLQSEGLPLELVEDHSPGNYQSRRMTMLVHKAAALKPDWVLPLDCDEFLLLGELGMPATTTAILKSYTYVPRADDRAGEINPLLRIRHRNPIADQRWMKVAIPGPLAAEPGLVVAQGNHYASLNGQALTPSGTLGVIQHFPVRSPAQAMRKTVQNRLENLSTPEADDGWGYHQIPPFERAKKSPARFLGDIDASARDLGLLPDGVMIEESQATYLGGELKYTPAPDLYADRAAASLLFYTEKMARALACSERDRRSTIRQIDEQRSHAEAAQRRVEELQVVLDEMQRSSAVRLARALQGHAPLLHRVSGALGRAVFPRRLERN